MTCPQALDARANLWEMRDELHDIRPLGRLCH